MTRHRPIFNRGRSLTDRDDILDMPPSIAIRIGAKLADIPFYQQTKFELVLNRTTVKSLGLKFPVSLFAVADEVIE